ncbi:MAG: hypothetical protein KAG66_07865, partial [Methylococcales bacterium]|nr:hypothetical protein [Methylococcales bacterium]
MISFLNSSYTFCLIACGIGCFAVSASAQETPDFAKRLQPFMETHCYECHDDLTAKGDLDMLDLKSDLSHPADMEVWMQIYDRVAAGEMPPRDKEGPSNKHRGTFLSILEAPLVAKHAEQKGT